MQLTLVAIALFASVAFATPVADNGDKSVIARSEQPAKRDYDYQWKHNYKPDYKHEDHYGKHRHNDNNYYKRDAIASPNDHGYGYDYKHDYHYGKHRHNDNSYYKRDAIASPEDHGYDYKHKYYNEHYDGYKHHDDYKHHKPGKYDGYQDKYYKHHDEHHGKDYRKRDAVASYEHDHEYKPEYYNKYYDGNSYHDKHHDKHYKRNYGKTHTVIVGGPGILAYNPPQLVAKKGDKIIFQFMEKNHTLTSSEFQTPCMPNGDFDTDFVPNPDNKEGITREFYVRDEMPQWFFCRQATHCSKGMVFALNPTPENTFEKFKQLALATAGQDSGVAIPPFDGQNNDGNYDGSYDQSYNYKPKDEHMPSKGDYMPKDDYKPVNNGYNNDYNNDYNNY